jgi:predicted acylesterase/phospholipase RssA
MNSTVKIVYGPTGGRFPFLSGVIDVIEEKLEQKGIKIVGRIGVSGGALSASIKASGNDFLTWLASASQLKKEVQIDSSSLWNLISKKGLIDSDKALDGIYRKVVDNPPYDAPFYAISWCTTVKKGVSFDMSVDMDPGKCLLATSAVPIAFSPVRIPYGDLPRRVQNQLGPCSDRNKLYTFMDGGLCPVFPSRLVPEEDPTVPLIVVSVEGKPPKTGSWFTRTALSAIQSKTLNGIERVALTRPVYLIEVSPPAEVNEFAAKFDITNEKGTWMYELGVREAKKINLDRIRVVKNYEEPLPKSPVRQAIQTSLGVVETAIKEVSEINVEAES